MAKFVLSVDGGGIRGIISAVILAEIEERTRKPISQIFDLMVGTSTGAIVLAGVSKKDKPLYSASEMVELYQESGQYIFMSSFPRKLVSWFYCAQYSHKNIEYVLDRYFGDSTLADISSNLLITSYDVHNGCPFFFKSWKKDRNFTKLKDALRSSTAAPTYFEPKYLKINDMERVLIDGGVFANDPAACAYANSKRLFPDSDIVLFSIGTGRLPNATNINSKRYGKITWIKPLLDIMFSSSIDAVDYELHKILECEYIRIQSPLKMASIEMDNATTENIKNLKKEAQVMISNNQQAIEKLCKMVT
ncbi:patatin-like phospholipase family protein [Wolbachia endosymbiont of Pentidionis agamae]|uniref:patatin-like phospholipase family protein n=1 Tax=Wolbachia endosymbiont of Pentidionis agamae TaxID=3110435 RepID=UPI002FD4AE32